MAVFLTKEKVDELWAQYQLDQAPNRIATKCKVSPSTITRLIEKGDPQHGIEAFKVRMKKITARADEKTAIKIASNIDKVRALITKGFAKMFVEEMVNGKKVGVELREAPSFTDLDKMMRLEEFLSGGADSRVEHQLKGEVGKIINDVIEAVKKVVKDEGQREKIAHELDRIRSRGASREGVASAPSVN